MFPKKKFCLRPPTLDLSKRPLSDFVFKIDGTCRIFVVTLTFSRHLFNTATCESLQTEIFLWALNFTVFSKLNYLRPFNRAVDFIVLLKRISFAELPGSKNF